MADPSGGVKSRYAIEGCFKNRCGRQHLTLTRPIHWEPLGTKRAARHMLSELNDEVCTRRRLHDNMAILSKSADANVFRESAFYTITMVAGVCADYNGGLRLIYSKPCHDREFATSAIVAFGFCYVEQLSGPLLVCSTPYIGVSGITTEA